MAAWGEARPRGEAGPRKGGKRSGRKGPRARGEGRAQRGKAAQGGKRLQPIPRYVLLWSQGGVSNVLPYRPPSPPACSCARRAQRLFISGSGFRKNPKTCQRKSRKQKKLSPPLAVRVRPCPSVWLFTSVPGFRFQVSGKTPAAPSTGLAPVCLRLRFAPPRPHRPSSPACVSLPLTSDLCILTSFHRTLLHSRSQKSPS